MTIIVSTPQFTMADRVVSWGSNAGVLRSKLIRLEDGFISCAGSPDIIEYLAVQSGSFHYHDGIKLTCLEAVKAAMALDVESGLYKHLRSAHTTMRVINHEMVQDVVFGRNGVRVQSGTHTVALGSGGSHINYIVPAMLRAQSAYDLTDIADTLGLREEIQLQCFSDVERVMFTAMYDFLCSSLEKDYVNVALPLDGTVADPNYVVADMIWYGQSGIPTVRALDFRQFVYYMTNWYVETACHNVTGGSNSFNVTNILHETLRDIPKK